MTNRFPNIKIAVTKELECPLWLNCLWGRIDNRVKIPSGTAAVSAKAGADESRPLGNLPEKALPKPLMRKPEDLLE